MNRRKFIWGMYTLLLLAMCFVMVSCEFGSAFDENFQIEQYPEGSKKNPINLTVHKWTNKEIISVNSGGTGVQWFSFVAADTTQYIYAKLSTISGLDVYLYDSDFNQIGSRLSFTGSSGTVRNAMYSLRVGATYFVKVEGYRSDYAGRFWIGFTRIPAQPETLITRLFSNSWINGNIIHPSSGGTGVQWFSFVATDATQYIYVKLSTISGLDVYLYDSDFNQIGSRLSFTGSSGTVRNAMYSLRVGATYFVKVEGYYSDYTGSYWVTFNETGNEPQ